MHLNVTADCFLVYFCDDKKNNGQQQQPGSMARTAQATEPGSTAMHKLLT